MTQRHEEQKRERRRAAREADVGDKVRIALASEQPAVFHIECMRDHEDAARMLLAWSSLSASALDSIAWRRDRISGHAIRAIVSALRELLS